MSIERARHPGVLLKERFLDPLGITPRHLAHALGVPGRRVAELVAGRRALSADMALRLGLFFDVPARWWLEMQARFDSDDPERQAALRPMVTPFAGLTDVLITPTGVRHLDAPRTEAEPMAVAVPPDLLARLRAQAKHAQRRIDREPAVVLLEDGTPILTGK